MVISSEKKKKLANAMGGKTARACDNCIRKRARWYCAADDVFLCQFCDALAHSANPLARLHQRVRLKIASSSMEMEKIIPPPKWHQGFTKKSRTPRAKNRNKYGSKSNPIHLVPEIGSDEMNVMNSDEKQLSYDEVPVFDPFSGEVCFSGDFNDMQMVPIQSDDAITPDDESEVPFDLNELVLPSDLELAEFAADVESLLGKNVVDEESCRLNMDSSERVMKVEEEMLMMMSFDYDSISSAVAWEEEEDEKMVKNKSVVVDNDDNVNNNIINVDDKLIIKKMLKLDYEGIIAAWDDERSPWATGDRPQLDCLLDCMHSDMGMMMMMGKVTRLDGGREARVSRYREKRRRRLFSKKIRYQVRKLNAEKRPRIKGRFVKRSSFVSGFPLLSTS